MTSPNWQELRDAGGVLFDQPDYGLGIYASTHGNVVIAVRRLEGSPELVVLSTEQVQPVIEGLDAARARAIAVSVELQELETAMAAHELIQRVKRNS